MVLHPPTATLCPYTPLFRSAAAMLEAHEDDLVFENGSTSVKGAPGSAKSFASVAGFAYIPVPLPEGLEPGLSDEAFFEPDRKSTRLNSSHGYTSYAVFRLKK